MQNELNLKHLQDECSQKKIVEILGKFSLCCYEDLARECLHVDATEKSAT